MRGAIAVHRRELVDDLALLDPALAELELADDELARLGTVLARDGSRLTLRVPERAIPSVVGHLLGQLHAADLAIEDPPLEEILRVMFGRAHKLEEAS